MGDPEALPQVMDGGLAIKLEQLVTQVLKRSPLAWLVLRVAHVRASVHTKLLVAFLIITLLFIAMAVASLLLLVNITAQSRLLDQAHERVSWSMPSRRAWRGCATASAPRTAAR